ncbi:helix-turn-helix domain-containing protein [Sphingomonas adhaesiva]|uniref:helix-turn-helix domain-containing protein n=1 Tax=Sphingomonas adhaesiva TaxID=28212 RepID=UPI003FA71517
MLMFNDRLCKAARALLGWNADDLARAAEVGVATVRRFETGNEVRPETGHAIQRALEAAGVEFVEAGSIMRPGRDTSGAGVRLRG